MQTLMPKTWKLPRYRHASYADQYSRPERLPPSRAEDDEFRDPPDIRFPNQWERKTRADDLDLTKIVRSSPGLPPRPNIAPPEGGPGGSRSTWPAKGSR